MEQDKGASLRDRATAASQSNPSVSSKAGIPSAGKRILERLDGGWRRLSELGLGDGRKLMPHLRLLQSKGLVESKMDGWWLVWRRK